MSDVLSWFRLAPHGDDTRCQPSVQTTCVFRSKVSQNTKSTEARPSDRSVRPTCPSARQPTSQLFPMMGFSGVAVGKTRTQYFMIVSNGLHNWWQSLTSAFVLLTLVGKGCQGFASMMMYKVTQPFLPPSSNAWRDYFNHKACFC